MLRHSNNTLSSTTSASASDGSHEGDTAALKLRQCRAELDSFLSQTCERLEILSGALHECLESKPESARPPRAYADEVPNAEPTPRPVFDNEVASPPMPRPYGGQHTASAASPTQSPEPVRDYRGGQAHTESGHDRIDHSPPHNGDLDHRAEEANDPPALSNQPNSQDSEAASDIDPWPVDETSPPAAVDPTAPPAVVSAEPNESPTEQLDSPPPTASEDGVDPTDRLAAIKARLARQIENS